MIVHDEEMKKKKKMRLIYHFNLTNWIIICYVCLFYKLIHAYKLVMINSICFFFILKYPYIENKYKTYVN